MRPLRLREAQSLVQKAHSKAVMEPAPDSQCHVPGPLDSTLQLEAGRSQACAGNRELQLKLRAEKRIPPLQAVGARHSPALAPCLLTPLSPDPEGNQQNLLQGGKQPRKAGPGCLKKTRQIPSALSPGVRACVGPRGWEGLEMGRGGANLGRQVHRYNVISTGKIKLVSSIGKL